MRGVFLDLETNGLDPWVHVPLEIAFRIVDMQTGERLATLDSLLQVSASEWDLSDPVSLKVNGCSREELKEQPSREEIGKKVNSLFEAWGIRRGEAVFVCQNPSFDRAFFSRILPVSTQELQLLPYHWLDLASMYWAQAVAAERSGHPLPFYGLSKDRIAEAVGLPPEEKPHRAMNGVDHLLLCYEAVVGWPKSN